MSKPLKLPRRAAPLPIQVDGYFIDYPIVEKARRVLAVAAEIEARKSG